MLFYEPVDLNDAEKRLFVDAMEELRALLCREPVGINVRVGRIPVSVREDALDILNCGKSICERNDDLLHCFVDADIESRARKLIVGCSPDHPLAEASRENNPDALWGGALGPLAVTYRPSNRYLIWHESLHLLGAMDCHDLPDRGPTCEQSNCIMQYEPTDETVGAWPFLCGPNIERIRGRLAHSGSQQQ